MPLSTTIGLSSRCFGANAHHLAVLAARAHHANGVEIACSTGTPSQDLRHLIPCLDLTGVDRLTLRAEHFKADDEFEKEALFAQLEMPVVVSADCIRDRYAWRSCEHRLLIANAAHLGRLHAIADLLDDLFDALPEAGLCLDASAAHASGGFPLLTALARRYADRLAQINVGTEYAYSPLVDTRPSDVDLAHAVVSAAELNVPIVVERTADTAWSSKLSQDVLALRERAHDAGPHVNPAQRRIAGLGMPSNSVRN